MMFLVELSAGLHAGSSVLLSDSLENFGAAQTYGLGLYVPPQVVFESTRCSRER
jgi:Co/Zn/Cd efflux system component